VQIKKALVAIALVAVAGAMATPAQAELEWLSLTLCGSAGYATFDDSYELDDGIPLEARAGLTFFRYVGVEATFGKVLADYQLDSARDYPLDHLGGDLVLNLMPSGIINPYLLGGWAELRLDHPDRRVDMNGWEYGGGLKIALVRKEGARINFRIDARNVVATNDAPVLMPGEKTNHLFITGGIHLDLFGTEKDTDRDGVADGRDKCPDTPYGAEVDGRGCPLDTDNDGVYDGLDLCAGTPEGAVVDSRGCPLDTDNDGVINGIDQCDGTPEGAVVDETGCPVDTDGDGVADGLDNCTDTQKGVRVDDFGCPKDSDGDGVYDGLDRCEGTPSGVQVDEFGCPVPINEMEKEFVDTGMIQLQNIYFETGKATLKPESHQVLHDVAAILVKWPSLKIEIAGHADSRGDDEFNLELSRARAHAVLDYLIDTFPELKFEQFFVQGYGETQPIASNDTAEGRRMNRRVEFRVLNREDMPKH